MSAPYVTAIVLNTRAARDTVRCVHTLLGQTMAASMEILVVDNHSEDESVALLRATFRDNPQVRILEAPRNLGFGKGYDIGIRQARGKYILINNPVKLLENNGVERMAAVLDAQPDIGMIGPKLLHADGSARLSPRRFPRPLDVIAKRTVLSTWMQSRVDHYLQRDDSIDRERDTDWLGGGCILVRASALSQVGAFDPRFFLFFEDIDLCRRFWLHGWRVHYAPSIVATDRKQRFSEMPAILMPLRRVGRAHLASAVRYFAKWRGEPLPDTASASAPAKCY